MYIYIYLYIYTYTYIYICLYIYTAAGDFVAWTLREERTFKRFNLDFAADIFEQGAAPGFIVTDLKRRNLRTIQSRDAAESYFLVESPGLTVVGCKIPRKENSPIFFTFFAPPPPSCFPEFTRG